jgi:hypothetical protein
MKKDIENIVQKSDYRCKKSTVRYGIIKSHLTLKISDIVVRLTNILNIAHLSSSIKSTTFQRLDVSASLGGKEKW